MLLGMLRIGPHEVDVTVTDDLTYVRDVRDDRDDRAEERSPAGPDESLSQY